MDHDYIDYDLCIPCLTDSIIVDDPIHLMGHICVDTQLVYIFIEQVKRVLMKQKIISWNKPKDFNPKLSAVGIYIMYKNQILFLKYAKKYSGAWTLPAGKVDANENPKTTIMRETFEEAGLKINKNQLKFLYTAYVNYLNSVFLWNAFRYDLQEKPVIKLSDEHSEYIWVTPEEALKMNIIEHEHDCLKRTFNLK